MKRSRVSDAQGPISPTRTKRFRPDESSGSSQSKLTMKRSRVNDEQEPISPTRTKRFRPEESTQAEPVTSEGCERKKWTIKRLRVNDAQGPISPTHTKRCRPDESIQSNPSECCEICRNFLSDSKRLKVIEEKGYCPSFIPPLKDGILDLSEATRILLKACFDGKLDVVQHIVEQWSVDVNTVRVLPRWGLHRNQGPLYGATPLIAAVVNRQDTIVEYFVGKGADLSIYTCVGDSKFAGMTALHIALSSHNDTSNERPKDSTERIIKCLLEKGADPSALTLKEETMWMLTDDESATMMLINSGMRLDQRNPGTGQTVLHYWAGMRQERASLDVVKLLHANGAQTNVKDKSGTSPLQRAAFGYCWRPNSIALEYFLNHTSISRQEEIDALELAGSTLIIPDVYLGLSYRKDFALALEYWRRATLARQEGGESFKKTPLSTITDIEWTTLEDLEEIQRCPNRRLMQGLLVGLRILGTVSSAALSAHVKYYVHLCTRKWTGNSGSNGKTDYPRLIGACWKILEVIQGLGSLDFETRSIIHDVGHRCVDALIGMIEPDSPLITAETFLKTLQVMTFHLFDKGADKIPVKHSNGEYRCMKSLYGVIKIMVQRRSLLTKEIMEFLHKLVRLDQRDGRGCNLLLYACQYDCTDVFPTVELLLKLGADPNCEDYEGNSALHFLVKNSRRLLMSPSVSLLLQAGCHIDKVNKAGEIAFKPWQSWTINSMASHETTSGIPTNDVKMSRVPTLACSSARIVRKNFDAVRNSTCIPKYLERFILWH